MAYVLTTRENDPICLNESSGAVNHNLDHVSHLFAIGFLPY